MKIIYISLMCIGLTAASLRGQDYDTTRLTLLEPYDFHLQYLRNDSSLLIDVREPFEFRGNRIKGSINMPSSGDIERAADTLNKNLTYFLYCSTDYRSIHAAEKLYDMGFRKLFILKGGIIAWKKDNMKVDKKRLKRRRDK